MLERLLTRFVERLADRTGDSLDRAIPIAAQAFGARLAERFADKVNESGTDAASLTRDLPVVGDLLAVLRRIGQR